MLGKLIQIINQIIKESDFILDSIEEDIVLFANATYSLRVSYSAEFGTIYADVYSLSSGNKVGHLELSGINSWQINLEMLEKFAQLYRVEF